MSNLIAVYGSLRKGMGNHDLLKEAEYLGKFESNPIYDMYALGRFPGIVKGSTSITMEVYKVDKKLLSEVDTLEGYHEDDTINDFYNRVSMKTPYGLAYTYIYLGNIINSPLVQSGDWVDYYERNVSLKKLLENAQVF
jgi:gamma-glutamylcyclotransferase (GGCT)/AIG2-like uncharacterized protein YtfP